MKIHNGLTNFIVETFSGAWNTLTELFLEGNHQNITPSNFEKLCAECVSLKKIDIKGWIMSEDLLKHVSKLKKLESLSLQSFQSSIITPLAFEQICTECVYLKTVSFDGYKISGNSLSHVSKLKKLEFLSLLSLQSSSSSSFIITPLAFEQICTECVYLKTVKIYGFETSRNSFSHVSKLKKLESLSLRSHDSSSINMSSFRGWTSSNMKELKLGKLSEMNLQVR